MSFEQDLAFGIKEYTRALEGKGFKNGPLEYCEIQRLAMFHANSKQLERIADALETLNERS